MLWNIVVDALYYGDTLLASNFKAMVDSGAGKIKGSAGALQPVIDDLGYDKNNPLMQVDCSKIKTLQNNLVFEINNVNYTVTPKDYINQIFPNTCVSGVSIMKHVNPPVPNWILGDVFIRTVYTIFDVGGKRIGFAPLTV
jgi:hypothetical protein